MPGILLAILVALGLIILILLVAPIRVRVAIREARQQVSLHYLGAAIVLEHPDARWVLRFLGMRLGGGRIESGPKKKVRKARKKPRRKVEKPKVGFMSRLRTARRHSPTIRRVLLVVLRLMGRLLRSWRLEKGRVNLAFGLGDPARTGMLLGYASAIRGITQRRWPRVSIAFAPDFNQQLFRLEADFTLRIIPLLPVYHVMRAVGTIPWWGLWKLKRA